MDSSQRQRLESALLLAFPDRESLNRMLFYKLSVSLDEIGDDNKQQNRLTNVVNWALNQNRLYQFLSGVLEQRPEDAGLRTIVLEISTQERSRLRQEWQDRVGRLQQLLDTSELPELRSSLEKLFSWSSAKTLNVESTLPKLGLSTFDALLDLIKRMHEDIAAGANPSEVVERTYTTQGENYQQRWWDSQTNEFVPQLLQELYQQLGSRLKEDTSNRKIPVVVLAMTMLEARQLVDLTAFENYPLEARTTFENFVVWLDSGESMRDWAQRYGESPEDWRPFGDSPDQNIRDMVTDVFTEFNEANRTNWSLEFKDIRYLIEPMAKPVEHRRQRRHLQDILAQGPLVIVDMLSLHHPTILRIFQQSALDLDSNTSIVAIAPIDDAFARLRQMSLILQLRIVDLELTKRIDDTSEGDACQEVYKARDFQKWLVNRVKGRNPGQSAMYNVMTSLQGRK